MPLVRDEIVEQMLTTVPRCISGFIVEAGDRPESWKGADVAVWRIACPCGCQHGTFLGYPLRHYNPTYTGNAFIGPLGSGCAECGRITEVFDTNLHGYHAEACALSSHVSGDGAREEFVCLSCQGKQFQIETSFFFWPASVDLVEDEPKEFEPRAQDLFFEFVTHGKCAGCGLVTRFTEFGKL